MSRKSMVIADPLVIMFEGPDEIICHIHPSESANSHHHYGMIVCDLVRHVARAFDVEEDDVWEWVDRERRHSTTGITNPS